jgi:hypothetical protein
MGGIRLNTHSRVAPGRSHDNETELKPERDIAQTRGRGAAESSYRTIASACILIFLISLDVTIVNVALQR